MEMEVQLHTSLAWALGGDEWIDSRAGRLILDKQEPVCAL